jgi:hypothetical protein
MTDSATGALSSELFLRPGSTNEYVLIVDKVPILIAPIFFIQEGSLDARIYSGFFATTIEALDGAKALLGNVLEVHDVPDPAFDKYLLVVG